MNYKSISETQALYKSENSSEVLIIGGLLKLKDITDKVALKHKLEERAVI
jgi:hypothetical protein